MAEIVMDTGRLRAVLSDLHATQLPYATARAINDTALAAQAAITKALPAIFDRPTPYTLRSVAVLKATKAKPRAVVFIKDTQAKYLKLEETGGTRSEGDNTRKPGRAFVLPNTIPLDAYGNIPAGTVARLVKQLQKRVAAQAAAPKRPRKRAVKVAARDKGVFYVPKAGHFDLTGGFYQRLAGHRLRKLIGFTETETYRPRFNFQARVRQVANQTFAPALNKRLREAIATAR